MSDIFKLVCSMSFSGSIIILILFLLKSVLKERFSKAWQYYIWMIVLLRLLLPFSPEFGLTNDIFHVRFIHNEAAVSQTEPLTQESNTSSSDNSGINTSSGIHESIDPAVSTGTVGLAGRFLPDAWNIAGLLWLAGMLMILTVKAARYYRFTCQIKRNAAIVTDATLLNLYQLILRELGIKNGPLLMYSGQAPSPMLAGLVKPAVYLNNTSAAMGNQDLSYVLRHELMHYKRHDLWYKWACDLTLSIHWFNPLIYLMGRQVNSLCEISCDEALTRDLSREEKLVYGNMLLNAASDNLKFRKQVLSTTLYEDKKSLKERIQTIMTAKRKTKRTVIYSVIITVILCTAAFMLGAYTAKGAGKSDNVIQAGPSDNVSIVSDDSSNTSDDGSASESDNSGNNADITDVTADNAASDNTAASDDTSGQTASDGTAAQTASDDTSGQSASDTQAASGSTDDSSVQVTDTPTAAEAADSIVYHNDQNGFEITLPASWKGYTVQEEDWQGIAFEGEDQGKVVEAGPTILIRHPEWTVDNPRQDIPIMVYTPEQWQKVKNEEISVSAAPIIPTFLSSNDNYVFALPARYNYAFNTGYEEVEQIIQDNFFK